MTRRQPRRLGFTGALQDPLGLSTDHRAPQPHPSLLLNDHCLICLLRYFQLRAVEVVSKRLSIVQASHPSTRKHIAIARTLHTGPAEAGRFPAVLLPLGVGVRWLEWCRMPWPMCHFV